MGSLPTSINNSISDYMRPTAKVHARRNDPIVDPEESTRRDILENAHERWRVVTSNENEWRNKALEELDFVDALDHWNAEMKDERRGLPCLTFDLIGPAIDQVLNDMRQSPPEPRVSPIGNGADKETAEVLLGIIRNIDNDSHAEIAYMTAYEHAVKIGRGWWRISFEYEDEEDVDNWQQKVVIKRIANPFAVYPDPSADEHDYSDMRYCFVTEDLDREVFEEEYPEAQSYAPSELISQGDKLIAQWYPNGGVRIAEYWWVETDTYKVKIDADGTVHKVHEETLPEGAVVVGERTMKERHVYVAKITGTEVLSVSEWPGKWIPVIPVLGREYIVHGQRALRGMIRAAMDANLSYDYTRSKEVEATTLSPMSQWLVATGQIEGHEYKWADANRKTFAYLEYNPIDAAGNQVPPPIRVSPQPASSNLESAIIHAQDDVKHITAIYDPSLGAPVTDQSGRAIIARQRESDNAHFNYHDNLARSIRHTGRVIINLIPHVYNEARALMILDPDGSYREVQINQQFNDQGVNRIYDLKNPAARFHVTVGSGPSYASRRDQAKDLLMQLAQSMPQIMSAGADLIVKLLDVPIVGDDLVARLTPPSAQKDQQKNPVILNQQLQQMSQVMDSMTKQMHHMADLLENKKMELESKERIANKQVEGNIIAAALKAKSADAQALLEAETRSIEHRLELLHEQAPLIAAENAGVDLGQQLGPTPPASSGSGSSQ